MKNIRYLCNMNAKNLYTNIGLSMCNALVISGLYPPQFSYRLTRQYNQKSTAFLGMYGVSVSLLLSAPAFGGGDFCVERRVYA